VLGKLATGGVTGLSKLLTYRIMTQPVRDAAFLRDFTMGYSNDDDNMLEILCTRTNNELRNACEAYYTEYNVNLRDLIVSKSSMYKNYRDFVLVILSCEKDESNRPLDDDIAELYAQVNHFHILLFRNQSYLAFHYRNYTKRVRLELSELIRTRSFASSET